MSIAQNLKILNKPINEIAMLSQETIMAMAQAGQIPVAFVAPILAQKAETDQRAAEAAAMMAQEQQDQTAVGSGTVIEKIIAQNAMNEAQQSMPMMPAMPQMPMGLPEDTGIASLPVPDESMPSEFASGGIVAFEAGGDVDYSQFGDIGEELKRQEALRKMFLGENEALRAEREGMDAAERRQQAFRLMEIGLGVAGGESPYFATNLKGAVPGIRSMAEDAAAQRKRRAELAGMERAEKGKVLESAMGAVQAREKLTPEDIRKAREIQAEARAAGKPVPTITQALKSIERTSGTATLQAAYVSSQRDAAKAVGELINSSTFNSRLKSIEKSQGKEAAEEYKRQKIRETVGLFPGVDPASVMAFIGGGDDASASRKTPTGTVDKNNPLLR